MLIRVTYIIDTSVAVSSDVSITGYGYTVSHNSRAEIVSYQWHPDAPEGIPFPHVHFGQASARPDSVVRPGEQHKVHFPTGFVSIEDVIRLLVEEFSVGPRRSDWREVLGQ